MLIDFGEASEVYQYSGKITTAIEMSAAILTKHNMEIIEPRTGVAFILKKKGSCQKLQIWLVGEQVSKDFVCFNLNDKREYLYRAAEQWIMLETIFLG
jgi:uncharacterized protein YcgI (DUF1989 family)